MLYKNNYTLDVQSNFSKIIKVIGVGGAGGNAVAHMVELGIHDVDFVVCNTDMQVLEETPVDNRLQLGAELTKGLGAGTEPEIGKKAAEESEKQIRELLQAPTEMVFITAGMGGGTGTGAAPVIARIAREMKLLTVAVVTDPFNFEGEDKILQANAGIKELKKYCDTVLVIKNDRLETMYGDMVIDEAYAKADDVLANAVKSIAELITKRGKLNLDFADVKKVLSNAGEAVMGSAEADGVERSKVAIEEALKSPLLENNDINGAKRILVSIAYSDENPEYKIKMSDQTVVTKFIEDRIKGKARLFKHGFVVDNTLGKKVRVTIVAAGFDMIEESVEEEVIIAEPVAAVKEKVPEKIFVDRELPNSNLGGKPIINIKPDLRPRIENYTEKQDSDQIRKMVEHFVRQSFVNHDLSRPSFVRNNINLLDLRRVKSADDVQVYNLQDLYEGLVAEKVL